MLHLTYVLGTLVNVGEFLNISYSMKNTVEVTV